MATRDRTKLLISTSALLWLGLMLVPAIVGAEELQQAQHPVIDFLFTAGPAATVHDKVYLEPVSVWYPSESKDGETSANALRTQATKHFRHAVSARGIELLEEPAGESLIVRIQYIDLTAAPLVAETVEWAKQFRFRVKPGYLTIVAEVRDGATGQVVMRIADLQDRYRVQSDVITAVDLALQHWSDFIVASISEPSGIVQIAGIAGD